MDSDDKAPGSTEPLDDQDKVLAAFFDEPYVVPTEDEVFDDIEDQGRLSGASPEQVEAMKEKVRRNRALFQTPLVGTWCAAEDPECGWFCGCAPLWVRERGPNASDVIVGGYSRPMNDSPCPDCRWVQPDVPLTVAQGVRLARQGLIPELTIGEPEEEFDFGDDVVLTDEQNESIDTLIEAIDSGEILVTLTGGPGTGKTTCGREIRARLRGRGGWVLFLAPTWRALLQARAKSHVPAATSRTLHAAIYAGPDLSLEEQIEAAEEQIRAAHKLWRKNDVGEWEKAPFPPEAQQELNDACAKIHASFKDAEGTAGQLAFTTPREWPVDELPAYIVVDEAGMVPEKIMAHLRVAFGYEVPVIGLGDGHQLGPVKGDPAFDLKNPTAHLVTSHRQTEGSPIHALVAWLTKNPTSLGRRHDVWKQFGFPILRASAADVGMWLAGNAAANNDVMCLVPRHAVRRAINDAARIAEGRGHPLLGPTVGERVVFRGHGAGGAVNGEFGTVMAVGPAIPSNIPLSSVEDPETQNLFDVFPAVVEVERLGQTRLVGGGVVRGAWHPWNPKEEGRIGGDLYGLGRRVARQQGRALNVSPNTLARDYGEVKDQCLTAYDEVMSCLVAANAILSAAPVYACLMGGFGLPIAPGRCSTTWVAQGSGYDNVAVILESLGWLKEWEPNYWFTAVSRARKNLYPIVITDRIY